MVEEWRFYFFKSGYVTFKNKVWELDPKLAPFSYPLSLNLESTGPKQSCFWYALYISEVEFILYPAVVCFPHMTPCIWRISSFRSFWCATNELFAIHKIIHDERHGQVRLILLPLPTIIDFICRFAKLFGGASDHAPILNTERVMRSRKLRRQVVLLRETVRLIRLLVQRKTPIGTLTTPPF